MLEDVQNKVLELNGRVTGDWKMICTLYRLPKQDEQGQLFIIQSSDSPSYLVLILTLL